MGVGGFIIRTDERVKKEHDALWSREQVLVEVYYGHGSLNYKITDIIAVKDGGFLGTGLYKDSRCKVSFYLLL
ncbi:hypothetical protein BAC7755_57870 [Bacillus sp. MN7755]|uniref:Uncharacterized protein n=1 Tax=Bacillus anthracis TaxID=1392 RepID=A0A2B0WW37_BACAN|nr:hypothetical protein COJ30_24080 [Bacillus anthracis]